MRPRKRKVKEESVEQSLEQTGGLEKKFINTYIGSGVFAKANIEKGAFVCTYTGDTLSGREGEARLKDSNGPCYLYFFKANGKYLCVDGTMSSCIGKYINDDHKKPNCKVVLKGQDLAIFTIRDIVQGEELRYDYGDKESFWRKKNQKREVLYNLPNDDLNSSSVSGGKSAEVEEDNCFTKDLHEYPESPETVRKDDDLNSSSVSGGKSAETEEDNCLTKDLHEYPESSARLRKDDDLNSSSVSGGKSAETEEDNCSTKDLDEYPESSARLRKDDDLNSSSVSGGKSAETEEDNCLPKDLHEYPESPETVRKDDDLNSSSVSGGKSAETEEDNCSTKDLDEYPESSATLRKDDDLNSSSVSGGKSAETEEDNCLTKDLHEYPESPETVRKDDDLNSSSVSGGKSAETEEDNCSTKDLDEYPESSARLRKDDDLNSSSVSGGKSAETEEDNCSTKDLDEYPESSATLRKDDKVSSSSSPDFKSSTKENSFSESDVSMTESLDDTDNDPDFSLEADCVSDSSSGTSEVIPLTVFPALDMEIKSSTHVKLPSNKPKTVYRSHNEVSSTTDGASNIKTKMKVQTSNNENGRKWDKTQYCLFCEKGYTNIRKHYLKSHKTEKEVKKILCLPLKSKQRSAELTYLRNAGNYKHNVSVLKEESGEFVVVARKSNDTKPEAEDYLPCEDCLGFFLREGLWRHKQVCPLRTGKQKSRRVQADAALLLPASNAIHAGLKENVFGKMVRDEVTIAARNDRIILKVGEKLYQKHGHLTHLYSHISQKMRELGRFLICSKTQDSSISCLNDILCPEKFPLAVQSTKVLCEFNEVTNSYKNPSLALKIGHLLKKCAKVAKSDALVNGDVERGSRADNFLTLCEDEWTDEISSSALQTLTRNKLNKGHLLPLSEDIMQLKKFLDQKTESLLETLNERFDKAEWELLNQMTLAQLVMFNRRRGGETQRMLIDAYSSRKQNKDCPQEVTEALSATEKILLSTLSRVEIRGKRGRTVPVLLTQKAQTCIELLLRWRHTAGVAKDNGYVFPKPNYGSLQALRSADVLRTFSKAAGLTNPELITSTRLRKHVATVAQVLSLSKNDLDIMASFMGHDITVHRSFYRLPQETLQVARMGRLLTALNNGTVGQYSGKSLDEIPLDETAELSSDEEMEEEIGNDDQENEVEDAESSVTDDLTIRQPHAKPGPSKTVTSLGQPKRLQKLSEEQSRLLKTLFKTNISLRRELRREDCEKVINKYGVLSRLSWQKIKNTIHNWITAEKRKTKKLL